MSSKNVLILILTISAINGNEDYFDTDPELHSSAMNIILNRLSARLNRVLSEFRSDLLKSSMEMVQNEASILVKAFDLKMQNVSKMIEKEAENRQSLQITLNSIVSFLVMIYFHKCCSQGRKAKNYDFNIWLGKVSGFIKVRRKETKNKSGPFYWYTL